MFGSSLDIERPFGQARFIARTRVRRRRLVTVMAALGLAAVLTGSVANAVGVAGSAEAEGTRNYVVRPGETLWAMATRFAPGADPRVVVDAIASANGVEPGALVPGQQLSIPSAG